ncbi:MAG: hypothetical protein MUC97_13805, partial [Bernardetiaceae bacterium]|nr:hypothetical protein [Bernardetiaceae bacterium]
MATGQLTKIPEVKSYKMPERAAGWLAWLAEPETPKKPEPKKEATKPDTVKTVAPAPVKPKKAPK